MEQLITKSVKYIRIGDIRLKKESNRYFTINKFRKIQHLQCCV